MVLHSYDAAQSKQFSLNAISGRGPGECRRALGKWATPHLHTHDVIGHELRAWRES